MRCKNLRNLEEAESSHLQRQFLIVFPLGYVSEARSRYEEEFIILGGSKFEPQVFHRHANQL